MTKQAITKLESVIAKPKNEAEATVVKRSSAKLISKIQTKFMKRGGVVYIMTNQNNTVLYTGVTSNLRVRVHDHKTGKYTNSFTSKYNCTKLVYYKGFHHIEEAIAEEKRIKGGNRQKKIELIKSMNLEWNDLWDELQNL